MYQIFGSKSSVDLDVMVFVDVIPSNIEECKKMCASYEVLLSDKMGPIKKDVNVNLAVIEDGIIVDCFKGTPDEVNNSLYRTYGLHRQDHPLQIQRMVDRNVSDKIARAIRIILMFLSRTQYRDMVKKALKGSTKDRIDALASTDIRSICNLGKNNQSLADFYKALAFQIGQCILLIEGTEVYTKEDIAESFPMLRSALNRKPTEPRILEQEKNEFLALVELKGLGNAKEPEKMTTSMKMPEKEVKPGDRPCMSEDDHNALATVGLVYPIFLNGEPISDEDLMTAIQGLDILEFGTRNLGDVFRLACGEIRRFRDALVDYAVARGIYKY